MILRYILAWIPMIFIGIINGIVREVTYGKYLNELRAHQVSTQVHCSGWTKAMMSLLVMSSRISEGAI